MSNNNYMKIYFKSERLYRNYLEKYIFDTMPLYLLIIIHIINIIKFYIQNSFLFVSCLNSKFIYKILICLPW